MSLLSKIVLNTHVCFTNCYQGNVSFFWHCVFVPCSIFTTWHTSQSSTCWKRSAKIPVSMQRNTSCIELDKVPVATMMKSSHHNDNILSILAPTCTWRSSN